MKFGAAFSIRREDGYQFSPMAPATEVPGAIAHLLAKTSERFPVVHVRFLTFGPGGKLPSHPLARRRINNAKMRKERLLGPEDGEVPGIRATCVTRLHREKGIGGSSRVDC
jgi:hypothetical protein